MSIRRKNINLYRKSDMTHNPIIKQDTSDGNEFLTNNGKFYSPGNKLYDRYDGDYHIHRNGEICAGSHNSNVMQPSRFLIELPKKIQERTILLQSLNILGDESVNI